MFEADDTTTDAGVIAEPIKDNNAMRSNVDLVVIKPRGAMHISYTEDNITDDLKCKIFSAIDWFIGGNIA